MSDTAAQWLSSFAAIRMLRQAEVVDPVSTLTQLAEARQIRARAAWGRFSVEDSEQEFPQEPLLDGGLAAWPDIPADFWRWVNAGAHGTEIYGEAGVYAATVIYDPDIGDCSETEHIKLFGVTFHANDLAAFLGGAVSFHETPRLSDRRQSLAGRKPELDRWAEFGAALALISHTAGQKDLKSANALYEAASGALIAAGRAPLSKKTVSPMINRAHIWLESGGIQDPPQDH